MGLRCCITEEERNRTETIMEEPLQLERKLIINKKIMKHLPKVDNESRTQETQTKTQISGFEINGLVLDFPSNSVW